MGRGVKWRTEEEKKLGSKLSSQRYRAREAGTYHTNVPVDEGPPIVHQPAAVLHLPSTQHVGPSHAPSSLPGPLSLAPYQHLWVPTHWPPASALVEPVYTPITSSNVQRPEPRAARHQFLETPQMDNEAADMLSYRPPIYLRNTHQQSGQPLTSPYHAHRPVQPQVHPSPQPRSLVPSQISDEPTFPIFEHPVCRASSSDRLDAQVTGRQLDITASHTLSIREVVPFVEHGAVDVSSTRKEAHIAVSSVQQPHLTTSSTEEFDVVDGDGSDGNAEFYSTSVPCSPGDSPTCFMHIGTPNRSSITHTEEEDVELAVDADLETAANEEQHHQVSHRCRRILDRVEVSSNGDRPSERCLSVRSEAGPGIDIGSDPDWVAGSDTEESSLLSSEESISEEDTNSAFELCAEDQTKRRREQYKVAAGITDEPRVCQMQRLLTEACSLQCRCDEAPSTACSYDPARADDFTLDHQAKWTQKRLKQGRVPIKREPRERLRRERYPDGTPTVNFHELQTGLGASGRIHRLSYLRSQNELFKRLWLMNIRHIRISRRPDIDSFFCILLTLAAFRCAFILIWRPQYVSNVYQEQYLRINGCIVHETKHVVFGHGALCYGLKVVLVLPGLPLEAKKETFLKESEQKTLIDQILLPALQKTVPNDVLHHTPRSYTDVRNKSGCKREFTDTTNDGGRDIPFATPVPEEFLGPFWEEVCNRCALFPGFEKPILWLTGHDLKCATKKADGKPESTVQSFREYLDKFLHLEEEFIPANDIWVDFGVEDTATCVVDDAGHMDVPSLVLLRKTHCLKPWADRFVERDSDQDKLETQSFAFHCTRDAGAGTFATGETSSVRLIDGVARGQAYSVIEDVISTPLKRHAFGDSRTAGMAYTQRNLEIIYDENSATGKKPSLAKTVERDMQALYRVLKAWDAAKRVPFGIRQEFRTLFARLRQCTLNQLWSELEEEWLVPVPDPATLNPYSTTVDPNPHWVFWILDSEEVFRFAQSEILRFHTVIETLSSPMQIPSSLDPSASLPIEKRNSVMLSAAIGLREIIVNGLDPKRYSWVWRKEWKRPPKYDKYRDHANGRPQTLLGLNIQGAVEQRGMAWIDPDILEENGLYFRRDVEPRLGMPGNKAVASLHTGPLKLLRRVEWRQAILVRFREECRRHKEHCLSWGRDGQLAPFHVHTEAHRLGAELVISSFIKELLLFLSGRVHTKLRRARRLDDTVTSNLNDLEREGLCGISFSMLARATGKSPRVCYIRTAQKGRFTYQTNNWVDRIAPLFQWTNIPEGQKPPRWHSSLRYRSFAQALCDILTQEHGKASGSIFEGVLCAYASRYLLLAPHFDYQHFCTMESPQKGRNPLSRSKFIVPTVSEYSPLAYRSMTFLNMQPPEKERYSRTIRRDFKRLEGWGDFAPETVEDRARVIVWKSLGNCDLLVLSSELVKQREGFPRPWPAHADVLDPAVLGWNLLLDHARDFYYSLALEREDEAVAEVYSSAVEEEAYVTGLQLQWPNTGPSLSE